MTGVRPPVVVGLSRHLGTSTLAAALHAVDGGLLTAGTAGEADVVLCRADAPSLRHAVLLAGAPGAPRPVLVLAPRPTTSAPPVQVAGFCAVVALPHVGRWAGAPDACGEAPAALAFPPDDLPPGIGAYAAALRSLVSALTGSELLRRAAPPLVSRPTTGGLWRGLRPLAHPVPAAQARLGARAELDDDALDAEPAGQVR